MKSKLQERYDYLKKVKEIENKEYIDETEIQELLVLLVESEDIREYSDWKGCYTALYQCKDFDIRVNMYYPENKLSMDDNSLDSYKIPSEDKRYENLKKEITEKSADLNGQIRCSLNKYLISKLTKPNFTESTKKIDVAGRDEMISFLKNNFFIPLNDFLKAKNLIPVDIAYVEYSQEYKDDEGYIYPELLHFNVNNWSTIKLSLNGSGKIHREGTSLDSEGLGLEYIMFLIIAENMDWVKAMPKEQYDSLTKKMNSVQMKTRDSVIYSLNIE